MAVGLGLTVWPAIIQDSGVAADPRSVIRALLGGLGLLSLLGLRYPLKMLPLLMFELVWKVIWVVSVLPLWLSDSMDGYGQETFFACLMGIVLVPIVMPWGYLYRQFVRAPGDPLFAGKRPD